MRHLPTTLIIVGALLGGCVQSNPGISPSSDRFYYPTGIAYVPAADGGLGFVYVVSSNFDLRFNRGTLAAVDVSALPLPADAGASPLIDTNAHIASQVKIDSYGGPVALYAPAGKPATARRLFVAGRASNTLDVIDVDGPALRCARDPGSDDCSASAISLTDAVSDAYRPVVVDGKVYVDHLTPADNPHGSEANPSSALARVDAETLAAPTILPLQNTSASGTTPFVEPVDGMARVGDFLLLGGRATTFANVPFNLNPLRVMSLTSGNVSDIDLSSVLDVRPQGMDTRGMAVSSDGSRLYLVTRGPDALVTLDITLNVFGVPQARVLGLADLPQGATEVTVIPRGAGRRDLVAVTCTTENVIALYDDEIGRVVANIRGTGEQPFAVTFGARPGGGVRLYSTSFGRGDIAVTDLPNLDDPSSAVVLATFGPNENCLNDSVDARPPECKP